MDARKINDKGQCPVCLRKPLVYKRPPHLFCYRCDRAYAPDTGKQIQNHAWSTMDGGLTFNANYPTQEYANVKDKSA